MAAIRVAAAGSVYFSQGSAVRDAGQAASLSPREREVVNHLVAGRSNDEIAAARGVTTRAVEAHLTGLYDRIALRSRAELAARAVAEGWLELPRAAVP